MENNNEVKIENNAPQTNKKKVTNEKNNSYIKVGLVILALLVVGFVVYKAIFITPENIYKNAIGRTFDMALNSVVFIEDNTIELNPEEVITFEGNTKLEMDELNDVLNGTFELDYNLVTHFSEKEISGNVDIKHDGDSLESVMFQVVEDTFYVISEELYGDDTPRYFQDYSIETAFNSELTTEDLKYIINSVSVHVQNTIKEENIVKESTNIKINDEDTKVNAYVYTIDDKILEETVISLLNSAKADENLLDILAKVTDTDKDDIIDAIEDLEDEVEINDSGFEIKISIYTKGLLETFAGYDIEFEDADLLLEYRVNKHSNVTTLEISGDEIMTLSFNGNTTEGTIEFDDFDVDVYFKITETQDNKFEFITDLSILSELDVDATGSIFINKNSNNESVIDLTFEGTISDSYDSIDVSLSSNNKLKKGGDIDLFNTNSAIDPYDVYYDYGF